MGAPKRRQIQLKSRASYRIRGLDQVQRALRIPNRGNVEKFRVQHENQDCRILLLEGAEQ